MPAKTTKQGRPPRRNAAQRDPIDLHASTTGRVAAILLAFGREPSNDPLTVSEIARRVGRERSQVSRMLKILASTGLLEQDQETHAYRLGWQMYNLATRAGDQRLLDAATPALRHLVAHTRETALLSVLYGNRSFTIARERSPQTVKAGGWIGRTSPLHASASGRALIMNMSDREIHDLTQHDLGAPQLGPRALRTLRQVRTRLRVELTDGYTTAIDELEDGLTSAGAPIFGPTGNTLAALNVSGPTSRLASRINALGPQLIQTAQHISRHLGAK